MLNHRTISTNCGIFKHVYKFKSSLTKVFISTSSQNKLERNFCESSKTLPTVELAYASYESTLPDAEESTKPPVLIMHGLLGSKSNWNFISKKLHQNVKRKIISIDARNHGDSPHTDEFSYPLLAEDVHRFMSDTGIQKATLLGHSMGGRIMMLLALKYPELVHSLIVVDISPIRIGSDITEMTQYFNAMLSVDLNMTESMSKARKLVEDKLSSTITVYNIFWEDQYVRQFLLTNLVQIPGGVYKWRVNLQAIVKNFQDIIQFIVPSGSSYDGPVLFIGGKKSRFLKPDDQPNIIKLFPKAEFKYIEGAGHWVHYDKPIEFLSTVCEFINDSK